MSGQFSQGMERFLWVGASDEAAGHREDSLTNHAGQDRPKDGLGGHTGGRVHEPGAGVSKVLAHVVGNGCGAAKGRQHVNEAEELYAKVRVLVGPVEQALLPPNRAEGQVRMLASDATQPLFQLADG